MKRFLILALMASAAGAPAIAAAQSAMDPSRFALGLGVGSNGGLVEGSYKLSNTLVLRGQGAFLEFNYGFNSSDVHYAGHFQFDTGGGFVDWHPTASPWLLFAGGIGGVRRVDVSAKPSVAGAITIHGVVYPVTQIGSVVGKVDYGDAAPVVGLGWDNTFYTAHRWGVRALAGVAFGDNPPTTTLRAIGPFAGQASVVSNVQAEQGLLQNHAADFSYYPVVQVGLNYRF